jgi:hypothetical protein
VVSLDAADRRRPGALGRVETLLAPTKAIVRHSIIMDVSGLPVFVFEPEPDGALAFRTSGEARAYLNAYLFSESLTRVLARQSVPKSHPVIYTITGQLLKTRRTGLFRYPILIPDGAPDDADLQTRLDNYATRRGLPVPLVDRIALANQLIRERWERHREVPPPLPQWLARRMPERENPPPEI